ncbi:MAG: hypothetical protein K940chlam1_00367 [Candidatus Anoxychlamydiales bacterium]|nr:hypothetical protein [Candidatus Anoxychlamydiales bacterium]NGX36058.1 hypothetical protein [Candidatus Anoxychlamydiales bacterium]
MPPVAIGTQEYNFYKLCPIPDQIKKRDQYKLDENETPSYSDNLFDDLREKKKAHKKEKNWQFSDEDWARISDENRTIEVSKDLIDTHVDRRVASFFEQLIVCYKVPYHFEIGKTMHQGESTSTLTKKTGNSTQKVLFDSAHSSTLPCLYAYDRDSFNNWKNGQLEEKPDGFVYLQDSDTYRLHNSTMGLIKVINQADIAIDGTQNDTEKLRVFAINKINAVAKGILTPMKGVEEFVDKAILITENQLANSSCKEKTKKILRIYLDSFKAIKSQIKKPNFFDYLLNVKSPKHNQSIRHTIYTKRFKIIRECHEAQSVIFQKIKKVSSEIIGVDRKPSNFNKAFKRVLLEQSREKATTISLEKLFNLSLDDFKRQVPNKNTVAFKKIETKENLQKIDRLINYNIIKDLSGLRIKELIFRMELFKKLRSKYKWTQVTVAVRYKALFPHFPMSQSGVSRIENQIKWIDHSLALEMAKVYRLDPGIFLPFLFTSLYV